MDSRRKIDYKELLVKPGKTITLDQYPTSYTGKELDKKSAELHLAKGIELLSIMQDKLYAHNQYSVLLVFQAMDAAGKDGTIKHIMSGLNPQGVNVTSFKTPSSDELDHDYFWRHYQKLPGRGEIGIFNRSHYENVLITKVHPEYILGENLPHIRSRNVINKNFWEARYKQICRFEKNLVENGTIILKFFLHVSKDEQKRRFMERIDNPQKNWKFSSSDIKERKFWDHYQKAYAEAISHTSTEKAPWFIIPADDKWFTRLAIAEIIHEQFEKLHLTYPRVSKAQKEELERCKQELLKEK